MKKNILVTLLALVVIQIANAQNAATPNPSFDNWTQVNNYYNPNSWNTLNGQTSILGVFTCTRVTDVHSGPYAIRLQTKSVFGITANGIASTATLITTPPYGVTGGIPFTQRPDSIVGWFKYTPASAADSGFVQFVLKGAANDTIGFVKFNTPNTTVGTYTRFSRPIVYSSAATPTLSYWILSASDGVNPVVNSSLFIDDLDLIFNSGVGVAENDFANQVHLISNMTTDFVNISNQSTGEVSLIIFDNSGKEVMNTKIPKGNVEVDVQHFTNGIYFYRLSQTGSTTGEAHGKLVKM